MKRKYLVPTVMIICAVFVGCQATPGDPVVIQKDMQQMIEKAAESQEATERSLREQSGAPETYSDSFTGVDGKLVINADAAVSVPDAGAIPIYRVRSAGFSEEFADSVYQRLCGGTKMYASSESFTKDAIAEEVLEQKLASEDMDGEAKSATEAYIKMLEESYQTAPETMGTQVPSVSFQTKQEYGAPYTVFEVRENEAGQGGKYFLVRNDTQYATEGMQAVDGETVAPRSNAQLKFYDADMGLTEPYEIREVMNEEKADGLETTPVQAQDIVRDLLEDTGAGNMEIYSVCLVADAPENSGTAEKYGYNIRLRRTVDGVCVSRPGYSTYVDDPSYGFEWHYETLNIGINDEGVYAFEWNAPLEAGEVIVDKTTLKPFDEIMDIFQSMMCIVNEPDVHIADRYKTIEFDITDITLSLQRVTEQNSITSGLLVPAWNFYGDKIFTEQDGTTHTLSSAKFELPGDAVEDIHYPFLSINAVDGSVIDCKKGY